MGRKPTGRKYPKHISIQVKEIHNEDLKTFCEFLNETSPLDNKWTIRDVILTLLYGNWKRDPEWFVTNHFEKLKENDLDDLRKSLYSDGIIKDTPPMKQHHTMRIIESKTPKENPLELSLDDSFSSFMDQLDQIAGEES